MAGRRAWQDDELRALAGLRELHIAAPRAGGGFGRCVPIWVVVVGGDVFVRTWQRRDTGWYGRAAAQGTAQVEVASRPIDVTVEVVGERDRDAVDDAYRAKYGSAGAGSMVTAEAAASTLLLTPADEA